MFVQADYFYFFFFAFLGSFYCSLLTIFHRLFPRRTIFRESGSSGIPREGRNFGEFPPRETNRGEGGGNGFPRGVGKGNSPGVSTPAMNFFTKHEKTFQLLHEMLLTVQWCSDERKCNGNHCFK